MITIKTIFDKILEYKIELLKGNIIAILATLATVAIPLLIPILVDELLLDKEKILIAFIRDNIYETTLSGYVMIVLFITLILRASSFLLGIWQTKIFLSISKDISYFLRIKLLKHLKLVSLKEYEIIKSGSISSKLISDIKTIDDFVGSTVSRLIISILTIFFTAIVLLLIDWKLALFILLTNPIVLFFTTKLARKVGVLKRKENQSIEKFQTNLIEALDLISQIRATNKDNYFFDKLEDNTNELKKSEIAFGYKSDASLKLSFLIFLSGYEIFRAVTILAVAYNGLSIGLMLAIFGYLWIMMVPIQDIINFQYALKNAKESLKRLNTIFDMKQERELIESKNPFDNSVSIEVKNLSFAYQKDTPILDSINLSIKASTHIALVGASGSGKTTLSNVLVGFYPQLQGDIYYNGINSKEINLSSIRENIHLILQNPKLFNETLIFNLTLGEDYPLEEINRAINIAQLRDVVDNLSDGLDTIVGRDGIKFSGGQRQRVAIARMILSNPKVIILDESTSALDIKTEQKLFESLKIFMKDKTIITIAHRLSSINEADYVYMLENGKIISSGKPEEMLELLK